MEQKESRFRKAYVEVVAKFSKDGILMPLSMRWEDGITYEINKVTDIRRATSLKAGGVGTRYSCIIDGYPRFLYYEDNNMWFVEAKRTNQSITEEMA